MESLIEEIDKYANRITEVLNPESILSFKEGLEKASKGGINGTHLLVAIKHLKPAIKSLKEEFEFIKRNYTYLSSR